MKTPTCSRRPAESGAALVITMFFIVIIAVMIVGFMDSSRVERSVAQTHFEKMRATTLANQGIEAVVATLRRETADPPRQSGESEDNYDKRRRNWTSQPGQLTVPDDPKPGQPINQKRLTKTVRLFSGRPTETAEDTLFRAPNLNVQTLADQDPATYLIDDPAESNSPVEMQLRWIYQREKPDAENNYFALDADGQPTEQPELLPNNPLVGRFAYWADDESTKINYNLAWSREDKLGAKNYNKNPPGHQTKIDLRALPLFTEEVALSLHSAVTGDKYYATINRFFNSPFDARQTDDPAIRAALDLNKFNLTHYNSDPDTTYYGRARMILTTQLSNAVLRDEQGNLIVEKGKPLTRPFLDILKRSPATSTAYVDPGYLSNIDGAKLHAAITTLVSKYLKRDDWPMVDGSGRSLQAKYYADYVGAAREERLAQLALNIIDYVRSAESRKLLVEPIRAKYKGGVFTGDFIDTALRGQEDTYKGLTRGPHITELGMWVADKAETGGKNVGRFRCFAFIELFLPPNYGIEEIDLLGTVDEPGKAARRWQVYFYDFTGGGRSAKYFRRNGVAHADAGIHSAFQEIDYRALRDQPESSTLTTAFVWEAIGDRTKAKMKPGEYRTVAIELWRDKSRTAAPNLSLRGALTIGDGNQARIDVAPLGDPGQPVKKVAYPLDPLPIHVDTILQNISSYETADPRVNGVANDWKRTAKNTFGFTNNGWLTSVGQPTIITKATEPEQDLDKDGRVTTASMRMPSPYDPTKLANPTGRVRSPGDLGLIHTGIEGSSVAPRGGIPWRTLRLQPSKLATDVVPDWAFMDLFTVPADVPLKAAVLFSPRGTATGGRVNMNAEPVPFSLARIEPLSAVLRGCRKNTAGATVNQDDARNIAVQIYARRRAAGSKSLPAGKQYPKAAGTVPDVYESPGEVVEIEGVADQGEESEELVREIANLITARGNVFSVYTIGQALKQTPAGKLLVTGEQRQQAYIERYLVDKGTDTPDDDSVGFRTIYFRNLVP